MYYTKVVWSPEENVSSKREQYGGNEKMTPNKWKMDEWEAEIVHEQYLNWTGVRVG